MKQRILATVAALITTFATNLTAQMPRTMSYQGVLADKNGAFIPDGNHTLTLTLYDAADGGNEVFTRTQTVPVVDGIFNIIIGSGGEIPASIAFDRAYFLGVSVDGGPELTPRTALTAAPYALHAATADEAERLAPSATGIVRSINNISGNIVLQGAGATTVTHEGNTFTISSAAGEAGTNGILGVQNTDGTLAVANPNGPIATINIAAGGIGNDALANGGVTADKIAPGVIPTSLPPNGVAGGDLTGSYPNPAIAKESVTADKIAPGVIPTSLPPNGVAGGDLTGSYPDPAITKGAVTADKIADGAVTTDKIADNSITGAKIKANAVGGVQIAGLAVRDIHIADKTITTIKLADTAVVAEKIASGAIRTAHIANAAITPIKISTAGATDGQALVFSSNSLQWGYAAAASLVLPFSQTQASAAGTALFSLTNSDNGIAIYGRANGSGTGVYGANLGSGPAGVFTISNAANGNPAVYGGTNGTAQGGKFEINNTGSTAGALYAGTNGTGPALELVKTGGTNSTYILTARSTGVPFFTVDKVGSVYAGGNISAETVTARNSLLPGGSPTTGGVYANNIIYAWGRVQSNGTLAGGFGATVTRTGTGTYQITYKKGSLDVTAPVVTPYNSNDAAMAVVSSYGTTGCTVKIWQYNSTARSFALTDGEFYFHVTGSPTIE